MLEMGPTEEHDRTAGESPPRELLGRRVLPEAPADRDPASAAGLEAWWREEPPTAQTSDLALLSPDERARAERFHFDADRALFASAHALTRRALGTQLGCPPEQLRFAIGERGKPTLEYPKGARMPAFNLSHTRGGSLFALGPAAELGVDLESGASLRDPLELGKSVFHPAELEWLVAAEDAPTLRARFLRLWTLKEAYLKARGWGLGGGPATWKLTEIRLDPEALALRVGPAIDSNPQGWNFEVGELQGSRDPAATLAWAIAWRA